MTDNELTMKRTFSQNCKRIGCSDHHLNKQLEHAFTSEKVDGENVNCGLIQKLFRDIKFIVGSVRREHKQHYLSKKLILYCDTRFSSAYGMLQVFLSISDEVAAILDNKLLPIYSKIDKDLLKDVCEFFLPFDAVLDISSDNERPTLHRVFSFKQFLINKCEVNDGDDEGIKHSKLFLGKNFKMNLDDSK